MVRQRIDREHVLRAKAEMWLGQREKQSESGVTFEEFLVRSTHGIFCGHWTASVQKLFKLMERQGSAEQIALERIAAMRT